MTEIAVQQQFWNRWNASTREQSLSEVSNRQARVVFSWLDDLQSRTLDILEVGCGAGWLCGGLAKYGRVTATDLSDQVLARARLRNPDVDFVAGDFMALEFGEQRFDVVVSLEVLSHVADQAALLARISRVLRPGGTLMLATQNRPVLQRFNAIPPPSPGQLRRWVDSLELRQLLKNEFEVAEIFSVTPIATKGLMRLVNSQKLNRPLRALVGDRVERFKERRGLGWTLMARARTPLVGQG